ncbi:MAG: RNA polymerase sigma factor [Vicingaceae bacterium]
MEELDKSAIKKLVKGCIKGDRMMQKVIYERYYSNLMSICYRYARDSDEAKDLLHDGFMKIFKNLHKYNFNGSFEGWLRRLMINSAIDHYRKNKNIFSLLDSQSEQLTDEEENHDEGIYSEFNTQIILEAVQNLSPAYRTVFNLYAIEGYSHKEIAEKLNINIGTSKSNFSKAKMNLRRQLEKKLKIER